MPTETHGGGSLFIVQGCKDVQLLFIDKGKRTKKNVPDQQKGLKDLNGMIQAYAEI